MYGDVAAAASEVLSNPDSHVGRTYSPGERIDVFAEVAATRWHVDLDELSKSHIMVLKSH
jgi:hypothetical protein